MIIDQKSKIILLLIYYITSGYLYLIVCLISYIYQTVKDIKLLDTILRCDTWIFRCKLSSLLLKIEIEKVYTYSRFPALFIFLFVSFFFKTRSKRKISETSVWRNVEIGVAIIWERCLKFIYFVAHIYCDITWKVSAINIKYF